MSRRDYSTAPARESVTCMVCGRKVGMINHFHLRMHGLTSREYKELFPGEPMRAQSSSDWMRARPEAVEKRNASISRALTGLVKSARTRARLSAAADAQWDDFKTDPEKLAAWNKARVEGQQQSDAWKAANKKHLDEIRPFPGDGTKMQYCSVPTVYDGVQMRSRAEADFAARLDAVGLEWEYEPGPFSLKDGRSYTPDFYVPALDVYFEVKGFDNGDNTERARLFGAVVVTVAEMRQWN